MLYYYCIQYELLSLKEYCDEVLVKACTKENAMELRELAVRHKLINAQAKIERFILL
jgi:hypothetical protein